jgi:hypothetical protein
VQQVLLEYDTDMDIDSNPQPSEIDVIEEVIDGSHNRSLLDIVEEEVSMDSDVLEEESSNFEGFDGKYGPYFPNFTSTMIFIWIVKHMICE